MSVEALNHDAPFAARAQPRPPATGPSRPIQPVRLGPLSLPNRYFLAPLAGVSDWPFRLLCREMGAAIAHTEMISSHGLVHGGDQTLSYLERPPSERPFAIQVFGHDPEVLAAGARIAVENYGPVDAVDINMGCPVKKVCCHGAGAAMLKEPANRLCAECNQKRPLWASSNLGQTGGGSRQRGHCIPLRCIVCSLRGPILSLLCAC